MKSESWFWIWLAFMISLMFGNIGSKENQAQFGDLAGMKPFSILIVEGRITATEGSPPEHWSAPTPDDSTSGQVFLSNDIKADKAICLRLAKGMGPIQFRFDSLRLTGGQSHQLHLEYRTRGGAGAVRVIAKREFQEKATSVERALPDSGGDWRSVDIPIQSKQDAEYELSLQCYAEGAAKQIDFRNLSMDSPHARKGNTTPEA